MVEDEISWLHNFTTTREATRERSQSGITSLRSAENILVAGHLKLIGALLSCENVDGIKSGGVFFHLKLEVFLIFKMRKIYTLLDV